MAIDSILNGSPDICCLWLWWFQDIPHEVSQHLYTDEDLKPLIQRLSRTVDYSEELLRDWSKEFTRRLREAEPDYRHW